MRIPRGASSAGSASGWRVTFATEALEPAEDSSLVALRCLPEEQVVAAQLLVRRVSPAVHALLFARYAVLKVQSPAEQERPVMERDQRLAGGDERGGSCAGNSREVLPQGHHRQEAWVDAQHQPNGVGSQLVGVVIAEVWGWRPAGG